MKIDLNEDELDAYNRLRSEMAELPAHATIHYSDFKAKTSLSDYSIAKIYSKFKESESIVSRVILSSFPRFEDLPELKDNQNE